MDIGRILKGCTCHRLWYTHFMKAYPIPNEKTSLYEYTKKNCAAGFLRTTIRPRMQKPFTRVVSLKGPIHRRDPRYPFAPERKARPFCSRGLLSLRAGSAKTERSSICSAFWTDRRWKVYCSTTNTAISSAFPRRKAAAWAVTSAPRRACPMRGI